MYILEMSKAGGTIGMLLWIIVLFGLMYFFMARPQKQEQKRKEEMRADLAIGDTVLTTSGFYGTAVSYTHLDVYKRQMQQQKRHLRMEPLLHGQMTIQK